MLKKIAKFFLYLIALLVLFILVVIFKTNSNLNKIFPTHYKEISLRKSPEDIKEGERLYIS
jgi:hypothetical protein